MSNILEVDTCQNNNIDENSNKFTFNYPEDYLENDNVYDSLDEYESDDYYDEDIPDEFRMTLSMDEMGIQARTNLNTLIKSDQYYESLIVLDGAIKVDPFNINNFQNRSMIYSYLDMDDKAKSDAQSVIDILFKFHTPDKYETKYFLRLAEIELKMKLWNEVMKTLTHAERYREMTLLSMKGSPEITQRAANDLIIINNFKDAAIKGRRDEGQRQERKDNSLLLLQSPNKTNNTTTSTSTNSVSPDNITTSSIKRTSPVSLPGFQSIPMSSSSPSLKLLHKPNGELCYSPIASVSKLKELGSPSKDSSFKFNDLFAPGSPSSQSSVTSPICGNYSCITDESIDSLHSINSPINSPKIKNKNIPIDPLKENILRILAAPRDPKPPIRKNAKVIRKLRKVNLFLKPNEIETPVETRPKSPSFQEIFNPKKETKVGVDFPSYVEGKMLRTYVERMEEESRIKDKEALISNQWIADICRVFGRESG
jgi:hypothetical protein